MRPEIKNHKDYNPPLTIDEAAEYLRVEIKTMYTLKYKIGFTKPNPKTIYFSLEDLNKYKDMNYVQPRENY